MGAVVESAAESDGVRVGDEEGGGPFEGCGVVGEEVEEGEFDAGALGGVSFLHVLLDARDVYKGEDTNREILNLVPKSLHFVIMQRLHNSRIHPLGKPR